MAQILVTHLTRMSHPYVCVAGIDTETGQHIRPLPPERRLHYDTTAGADGFGLRRVMELGTVTPATLRAPHLEDRLIDVAAIRTIRMTSGVSFWESLDKRAHQSLDDLWTGDLHYTNQGAYLLADSGLSSLGYLRPEKVRLASSGGSVRVTFSAGGRALDCSVTDLSCFAVTQQRFAPDEHAISQLDKELVRGRPCLFAVGLARPWTGRGFGQEECWVQVNGVVLKPTGA